MNIILKSTYSGFILNNSRQKEIDVLLPELSAMLYDLAAITQNTDAALFHLAVGTDTSNQPKTETTKLDQFEMLNDICL